MLTSRFKVWRNPARLHIGSFPISRVFHASPCAAFDACRELGIGPGSGTGILPRGVAGRRHQAEDARDGIFRQTPPRHPGHLERIDRRVRARRVRFPVQGPHRHQDRYPAAQIGRRQLCRRAEFQPPRRSKTERRDALDQLLLAGERQPRLFRRAQPDLRAGPAAVQGRHDQGGHGQIRRAHHRRRSAFVLHLPQGLDHVGRRQVQGSRPRWKRSTSRSIRRPPSSSTAIPFAAVAWRLSSARRPRPRTRPPS